MPAALSASDRCVLALVENAVWVLEDTSSRTHPCVGRVLAQWARGELVSHIDPGRRRQQLELSWPRDGALVRAVIPTGPLADAFGGQLAADSPRGNSGRTLQLQGSTPNLESIWSPMVLETGYLAAIFKVETPGIEPGSAVA